MKKIIAYLFIFLLSSGNVFAQTILQALKEAYNNNVELNAERENLIVSEQDLKISKSEYLPSATITSSKSQENTKKLTNQSGGDATINDVDPLTTAIKIEQTLIDLGRSADYQKKKIGINLAREKLIKKEQDILYKAIEAYSGLVVAKEKEEINRKNVELKISQLENERIRLERGEIKLSDFAQSESSLAGAEAQYIQSQNEVITSKLNYENVIGKINNENNLQKSIQSIVNIPLSLENAIELSKQNNHDVKIAQLELQQAEKDITIAKSDLTPTASLSLERSYTEDLSTTYDEREKDVLKATVSWPFFSGGKNIAKFNKNKSLKTRKKLLLDNSIKTNDTNVASAWSNFQSNKSLLNSVKSQVKAAEIAYEGIAAEYQSGAGRTTLEVIQSNSILLNAQISLANSERNYLLSQFNLLKAVGLLNSNNLKIN